MNKYQPLSHEDAELFIKLTMAEMQGQKIKEPVDLPLTCQIIKRRVEALNLPVKLTTLGLLGTMCFAKSPGQAVALLIDFLTKFEGESLTVARLAYLYPVGFYTNEAMTDYIDNQLKPKKCKWSEIY